MSNKGLEWNQGQRNIAELLGKGKTVAEISKEGLCSFPTAKKVADALKAGQKPPLNEPGQNPPPLNEPENKPPLNEPKAKPNDDGKKLKKSEIPFTSEATEAALIRLTPKVQSIPLTPDIFIGYMCAVSRGYNGEMADWLSLASRDFWFGRNINPYEIVGGLEKQE